MANSISLEQYGINVQKIIRNAIPSRLYEHGLRNEPGTAIASSGAFVALSGEKTGRSPSDKRIVEEPGSKDDVWWGPVNMALDEHVFDTEIGQHNRGCQAATAAADDKHGDFDVAGVVVARHGVAPLKP